MNADPDLRNTFIAQVATNRANVCIKQRRWAEAVADAELAVECDEGFAKAYLRRAQAYMGKEEFQQAVRDFEKAAELEPSMPGIREHVSNAKRELKKSKRIDYYKVCCAAISTV